MGADELKKTEAAYRAAFRRAEKAREARNAAVLTALDEGMTHAAIAAAMGLTRGRVNQIAQQRKQHGYVFKGFETVVLRVPR